jgi:hypothetical protein
MAKDQLPGDSPPRAPALPARLDRPALKPKPDSDLPTSDPPGSWAMWCRWCRGWTSPALTADARGNLVRFCPHCNCRLAKEMPAPAG